MRKVRKIVVVLLMVFGAVSVSFGDIGYGNIDMLKAEMEEYEAYLLDRYSGDRDRAKIDCEDFWNSVKFYCDAKVGLLLLEEAKAKNIDYFSYDMVKFIWSDERFKYFRGYGYGGELDNAFNGIKRRFEENREERGEREARKAVWRGMANGEEID